MNNTMPGKKLLFAVEGVDGVGKSSTLKLAHRLAKKSFLRFKTPSEDMAAFRKFYDQEGINQNARFFYYLSANLHLSDKVKPLLLASRVCIDRFILSTIAYHNVIADGKDKYTHYISVFEDMGGLIPEWTVLLTADEKERKQRIGRRSSAKNSAWDAKITLSSKVQDEYMRLVIANRYPSRTQIIDTTFLSKAEAADRVKKIIMPELTQDITLRKFAIEEEKKYGTEAVI